MKRVMVFCATDREYRDLPKIAAASGIEILFAEHDDAWFNQFLFDGDGPLLDSPALLEQLQNDYSHMGLDGITSGIGYPGMSFVSILAQQLGLPGPRPEAILCCEHKFQCRKAQQHCVPEAAPPFALVDFDAPEPPESMAFPFFIKPVKSFFSMGAARVDDVKGFGEKRDAAAAICKPGFLKPLNDLVAAHTDFQVSASHLLAEGLLEGVQVSLDGYVYQGRVTILGIVDAVMYPGTISFQRFEYPSRLPDQVQERMAEIARNFVTGIDYDMAVFNIEMMYNADQDTIHIIEVNPKMANQFADLFEKVDGTSSYEVLLSLALGRDPAFQHGGGRFQAATSWVVRSFEPGVVTAVPSQAHVAALKQRFPDVHVQICTAVGKNLSDGMQDGYSFRYLVLNFGAESHDGLITKFQACRDMLPFSFQSEATVS